MTKNEKKRSHEGAVKKVTPKVNGDGIHQWGRGAGHKKSFVRGKRKIKASSIKKRKKELRRKTRGEENRTSTIGSLLDHGFQF